MPTTHEVRFHREDIDFGNLTRLAGYWQGSDGFNMIAVPDQKGDFELLVAPYTETLVVEKVQATTPNRGMKVIENIPTLRYNTTISESDTGALMHVEAGFWERSNASLNNGFDIFRIASIPHGNAVEAMGKSSVTAGPPAIDPKLSGMPTGVLPKRFGYTDVYMTTSVGGFKPTSPNQILISTLAAQKKAGLTVVETVTLNVSTKNAGGISNIASLRGNVNATQVDATYWIERLEDTKGNVFYQLQYSQRVLIEFPVNGNKPGETIVWPHISVNTLKLVS